MLHILCIRIHLCIQRGQRFDDRVQQRFGSTELNDGVHGVYDRPQGCVGCPVPPKMVGEWGGFGMVVDGLFMVVYD